MSRPLIGISGKGCSGKDTIADYLITNKGWSRKISFADGLKKLCADFFNLDISFFYDQGGKAAAFEFPIMVDSGVAKELVYRCLGHDSMGFHVDKKEIHTPRELLQFVGSDVLRVVDGDSFTKLIESSVVSFDGVVIPDVRFPNEALFILDNGGVLIRVERQKEYVIDSSHASETALDDWADWSYVLLNFDHGLQTLYKKIDEMFLFIA